MKVGMFYFRNNQINKWLEKLDIKTRGENFYGDEYSYTMGDIDVRLIRLLKVLYNDGWADHVRSIHNKGIYVKWDNNT